MFKLTNGDGDNLLDTKALTVDKISIYNSAKPAESLSLYAYQQENQTWLQAYLNRKVSEYVLEIKGVNSYT